ncbi:Cys-tRNA(Pro) deacylase [Alkalihalobacillus oceani]|uniref:Cys-tRNA(Pro) deacylase n=1 Tax=Halalkalibacter oceani TaxID=1653776 RepID=UPI00203C55E4|nr:Cys-tRNA(Pro) deacylase [Halalkalibacter oceani]MCM3760193.1 Cys-tRNA(Pro) deacylase [Halalkalibacter oceani]
MKKTNAMRLLDKERVDYQMISYETNDGKVDGVSVAGKIGKDVETVYKTLVAQGAKNAYYVFLIPVAEELDLKKAAKACQEKKVEMLAVKDLLSVTGYVRGGCSPIAMKKHFPTFIDSSARRQPSLIVSAGKIGLQLELQTGDLQQLTGAAFMELTK